MKIHLSPISAVLAKLPSAKPNGAGWTALCPAHEDRNPSLSIREGDDGRVLFHCHAGCSTEAVAEALGLTMAELFPDESRGMKAGAKMRIETTYQYSDEHGEPLFEVVRYKPKNFRQRRPDGQGGWTWDMKGVTRVLYRLPQILKVDRDSFVFLVEGEKDADRLAGEGLIATTTSGGASKSHLTDLSPLTGRQVVILPDNDEPGRKHVEALAKLLNDKAASVRVLDLPGLPDKGDASDWLDAGGDAEELVRLAEGTAVWEPEVEERPLPDVYRAFPVEALPEPLRHFVNVGASALGCDMSYIALPLLAALASAIGNTRRIQLKNSWSEPGIIWSVIVGESGTLKSPALELALRAVRQRQRETMREHAKAMEEHKAAQLKYEKELLGWKRSKNQDEPPTKPEEPIVDRCWTDDVTVEALAILLQQQPRGLLVARDELSGMFGGFDRYSQSKGGDVAKWLEMHGGRPMIVDRKTGTQKVIYVPRAAVSVAGGIQPQTLGRALGRENIENGLAARFLLAMPPRRAKKWTDTDIPREVEAKVEGVFDYLYQLNPNIDAESEPMPVNVPLNDEGRAAWVRFYNDHAVEIAALSGDLAAAWSKLEGYAARLSLVVHFVRLAAGDPTLSDPDAVDEVSIEAGVTLARWFGQEARRVYAVFGETDEEREQRQLVEMIRVKGGSATARDLMRSSRVYQPVEVATAALEKLVEAGLGHWHQPQQEGRGKPRSRVFVLDVDVVDADNNCRHDSARGNIVNVNTVNGDIKTSLERCA